MCFDMSRLAWNCWNLFRLDGYLGLVKRLRSNVQTQPFWLIMGPREPVGTHSANFLLTVFVLNLEKEEKNPFMLLVKVLQCLRHFSNNFSLFWQMKVFPCHSYMHICKKKTFTELIIWCWLLICLTWAIWNHFGIFPIEIDGRGIRVSDSVDRLYWDKLRLSTETRLRSGGSWAETNKTQMRLNCTLAKMLRGKGVTIIYAGRQEAPNIIT